MPLPGTTQISGELPREGHLETLTAVLLHLSETRTNLRRLELMELISKPDRVYVCLEVDAGLRSDSILDGLKQQLH